MYNSHQVYPIKLKGNSVLTSHISGHKDLFNVITNFKLDGNSTLYYMGATIGGDNQPVNLFLNAIKDGNMTSEAFLDMLNKFNEFTPYPEYKGKVNSQLQPRLLNNFGKQFMSNKCK